MAPKHRSDIAWNYCNSVGEDTRKLQFKYLQNIIKTREFIS